jgi:hypothetical protein
LALNSSEFPRRGRDDQLKAFFNFMQKRIFEREKYNPSERQANPLLVTQGSPGTGKSFLLDEIAAFKKEDIDQFCPEDIKSIVMDMVSVLITYNGSNSYYYPLDGRYCEAGLAIRVLWRLVFEK